MFQDNNAPVLLAAQKNHAEILELLMKAGADVNVQNKVSCDIPI
jgi:ankyrin repeat protein